MSIVQNIYNWKKDRQCLNRMRCTVVCMEPCTQYFMITVLVAVQSLLHSLSRSRFRIPQERVASSILMVTTLSALRSCWWDVGRFIKSLFIIIIVEWIVAASYIGSQYETKANNGIYMVKVRSRIVGNLSSSYTCIDVYASIKFYCLIHIKMLQMVVLLVEPMAL